MLHLGVPTDVRSSLRRAAPDALRAHVDRLARGQTQGQRAGRRLRQRLVRARADRAARRVPDVLATVHAGRPVLAHRVGSFRSDEVLAAHGALLADLLDGAGVPYFFASAEAGTPRVVVVAASRRAEVEALLAERLARTATYVAGADEGRLGRPRRVGRVAGLPGRAVRLFRFRSTASGQLLSGPELGVELQFWRVADRSTPVNPSGEPVPPGSLLGLRSDDRLPEVVPPDQQRTVLRDVDGRPRPWLAAVARPHLFEVTEPVDAVYTWVDGDDPAWQARLAAALARTRPGEVHPLAANPSRFASHDELRYALRSLDMYAGWVRRIHLVTDDQVPAWLRTDHPRLTVVSHRELFGGRGSLPTFNSHAIESQLHRLDGLAEHYLYLNDDVFFGRPVRPDQFVLANGLTKFFLSTVKIAPGPVCGGDLPVTSAAKNNRDLLLARYQRLTTHKFRHVPHALQRSVMAELEQEFAAEVEATAASPFRGGRDLSVSAALGHYYGFLRGRAVAGELAYAYVDINAAGAADRLEGLLRHRAHDVFCLNDHDGSGVDPDAQRRLLADFLERYFPLPSQFERTRPPAGPSLRA